MNWKRREKKQWPNLRKCINMFPEGLNNSHQPLTPLFVRLTHANYYKIVKHSKSFKIITTAPTCFGLHKPSSGSSQPVLRQNYNVDFRYIWLFEVIGVVVVYFVQCCYACGSCTYKIFNHNTDNFK